MRTSDSRIAYGVRCSWWDSIDKVGTSDKGMYSLPCCPHCGGMLFEMGTETQWWQRVDAYAKQNNKPDYRKKIEWSRGKCFRTTDDLDGAFGNFLAGDVK